MLSVLQLGHSNHEHLIFFVHIFNPFVWIRGLIQLTKKYVQKK